MSALLPCPFCGGAAMHIQQNYVIGCQPCGVWMADYRKDEWNRRTQPEAAKPAQDLSAAILALPWPQDETYEMCQDDFRSGFEAGLSAAAALASPANALVAGDRVAVKDVVRNALDLYADCYDRMERQNPNCYVPATSVAYDIRKNMIESTIAAIQAQKDGHG